jgi:hypothetical protein
LRQQLAVFRRSAPKRLKLTPADQADSQRLVREGLKREKKANGR